MGEVCTALSNAVVEAGFCAYELPIEVLKPRSVVSIGISDSLVLERTTQSVIHLFDTDGDLVADSKRTLVSVSSLNHGLAIQNGYIYASSDTTVYRWSYSGDYFDTIGVEEIVVNNINADGQGGAPQGHRTRTLAFDDLGRLYISVGSNGNVDADSHRSRIRRFDINVTNDAVVFPIDFQTGYVFADGLRNEVGLAFDSFGVLWGVENSADNLFRSDMGGDIHQDNPVSRPPGLDLVALPTNSKILTHHSRPKN
jgi:glucose/arabinose dehydrogenase